MDLCSQLALFITNDRIKALKKKNIHKNKEVNKQINKQANKWISQNK
jgi:hypothetical protein